MDKPLDNVVLGRMKNFAAMNKLKKTALMVVGACLSAEEIAGMKRLFKTIDADGSGTITVKELQVCFRRIFWPRLSVKRGEGCRFAAAYSAASNAIRQVAGCYQAVGPQDSSR